MPRYLIVDDVIAAQTPNIERPFLQILSQFDTIIEIGFHRGGFSKWLQKNKKKETKLYCFDISSDFKQIEDKDIEFIIGDCFEKKTQMKIVELLQTGGKCLILCDGGNKNKEFNTFAMHLKNDDVIMCHDYCENLTDYSILTKNLDWPHGSESNYSEIVETLKLYNLQKYQYEDFKNVLWGSFIKK